MNVQPLRAWVCALGLAALVGCSSEGRTGYFTFLLQRFPLEVVAGDTTFVDAYFYVPWGPESPFVTLEPCYLWVFDLKGRAVREVNASRTDDAVDQQKGPTPETGTYAQYEGDVNGELNGCGLNALTGRFTYGGSAYLVFAHLLRAFPNPNALTIAPGEAAYTDPDESGWMIEGTSVGGVAAFWPYERGPSASARAVTRYLTEPGR